jgi:hypothetical protein
LNVQSCLLHWVLKCCSPLKQQLFLATLFECFFIIFFPFNTFIPFFFLLRSWSVLTLFLRAKIYFEGVKIFWVKHGKLITIWMWLMGRFSS